MKGFKILVTLIFTIIFIVVLGYIDFKIITPLLPLPSDICYYHEHEPPMWVNLFYLDGMGHTEAPYSGFHMLLLFCSSLCLAFFIATKMYDYFDQKLNGSSLENMNDNINK